MAKPPSFVFQFESGHNEDTSSQKVKKELKLAKGRPAAISERPVDYQKGRGQTFNGWSVLPAPEIFASLHFFCSISFKRWLENQTILTVYLHFPKFLPCSGRIVNSLCPLRCEGEHGTITGLRCWGARGLPGQLFMWGLPAPNEPSRDERCFLHEGRMVPRVCPPGTVRKLSVC